MEYYDEEFNFKRELEEIHKKYILGLPSSGRIYRLLRNRDKKFIQRLKDKLSICNNNPNCYYCELIDQLAGFATHQQNDKDK